MKMIESKWCYKLKEMNENDKQKGNEIHEYLMTKSEIK